MWVLFSLLAGFMFGLRGALYHWTGKLNLNRNLMLSGVFSCGFFVYGMLTLATQPEMTISALVGVQMGLLSSIANGSLSKGFAVGKASLIAVLTALPPIVVVILAFFLWDERLTTIQLIAMLALILGLVIIRYSSEITLKNLQGVQWGLITLFFFAFNDLSGKWSTILDAPRYPTLMLMFLTGGIFFYLLYVKDKKKVKANPNQSLNVLFDVKGQLKQFGIGILVGFTNVLGMYFILEAFETGSAGLVSALTAIHAVIVLIYTRFIAKEKLSKIEVLGSTIILLAVVTIQVFKNS